MRFAANYWMIWDAYAKEAETQSRKENEAKVHAYCHELVDFRHLDYCYKTWKALLRLVGACLPSLR